MGRKSKKTSLENGDDSLRQIDELTEACNNAFSLKELNIAKRYRDLGLEVVLDLRFGRTSEKNQLFFKSLGVGENGYSSATFSDFPPSPFWPPKGQWCESNVNISIAQAIESPKEVVPSLVWLESPNQFSGSGRQLLYFSLRTRSPKLLSVSGNGEIHLRRALSVLNGQSRSKLVKSGSQLERDLSNNDSQHGRRLADLDLDGIVNAIGLSLTNDRVRFGELVGYGFDITEVLIGPCNLQLDPM